MQRQGRHRGGGWRRVGRHGGRYKSYSQKDKSGTVGQPHAFKPPLAAPIEHVSARSRRGGLWVPPLTAPVLLPRGAPHQFVFASNRATVKGLWGHHTICRQPHLNPAIPWSKRPRSCSA